MEVYEITGLQTAISRAGVNFLQPKDSFQNIENGYVYRQELKSRLGFRQFALNNLSDGSRVMGIFEHITPADEKVILAVTKQFLYKYNTGTNMWDQIPMAGHAPGGGFGIVAQDSYVSGTTYPFPDNTERFVFTCIGMTAIYQYDGTSVTVFNNVDDNPNYQDPASGILNKAKYVLWFGERLNFISPIISGTQFSQEVLFSGIRNVAGNGDKFNVPGSGASVADTFEYITGAVIAGDYMQINFNRSSWTLEKTRDAFNPYFFRKIPSVLGTNADFSSVFWANQTHSIGKTGYLISDGRESLRGDTLIPFYTLDEIDQVNFNLTYGGFDRFTSQFLFAYRSGSSQLTDITQDKLLVFNYEEKTWATYDMRFSVIGQAVAGINLVWNDIYEVNDLSWGRMDTTGEIWNKIGLGEEVQKTLAGDNNGFVYELDSDYDDYFVAVSNITQAATAVATITQSNFQVGDIVSFVNVGGMVEINGLVLTVIAVTPTSITVDINSSLFSPYTSGGTVSSVISFSAETIPFNPYRGEGRRVYVSHIEFLLNTNDGNLMLDVFADENETPFKTGILLQPTSTTNAREWITAIVSQEANFITFAFTQQNPSSQVVISSIRIHAERRGLTSA